MSAPYSQYARIDELVLSLCCVWRDKSMKEEVSSVTAKARGRLLHYLGNNSGGSSSRTSVVEKGRVAREAAWRERRVGRRLRL